MSRRSTSVLLAPVPFQASLISVSGWAERIAKRKPNGVQAVTAVEGVELRLSPSLAWATNVLDAVPRTPRWMEDNHIKSRVAKLRRMLEHPSPHPLQRRNNWSRFIEDSVQDPIAATLVLLLATTDLS